MQQIRTTQRGPAAPQALFGRKPAVVAEPPPPPAKKSLFGFGKKAAAAPAAAPPPPPAKRGLFGGGGKKAAAAAPAKKVDKAAEYKKRQGIGGVVSAFDFAEVRSKSDYELLYDAKYGKRGSDGKMTREQYAALRRKVGGTAKDFWKTSIDVKGDYVDKGYVSDEEDDAPAVPGLPFLVAVTVVLLAAGAVIVAQTS